MREQDGVIDLEAFYVTIGQCLTDLDRRLKMVREGETAIIVYMCIR